MSNKPLNILFLEPCPVNFGGYFRANNLCYFLAKSGHKVDLLITSSQKKSFRIIKKEILPNYHQIELPRIFINQYLQGRLLRALISIYYILKYQYDIYHIGMLVEPETNIPALFLKLIGKKNIVMDWDEIYLNGASDANPLLHSYINFCETYYPKIFPNFCVTSDTLVDMAKDRGSKHVLKMINAINPEQIEIFNQKVAISQLKLDPKYKYLLFLGNSIIGKRVILLFEYLDKIIKLDPSIRLITNFNPVKVLKDSGYYHQVNKSVLKKIINVGYIKNEEMPYFLAAASATIFFSENNLIERANFPIRIGTYLASESIIVTNDINSEATNTLKQYNCAILDQDYLKLPQKTIEVINNQKLIDEMKQRIKIAKNELSYPVKIKELIAFYRFIISTNG